MPAEASSVDLYQRLTELEQEVQRLRRMLRPTPEPLPAGRLLALKVTVGEDLYAVPIQPVREIVPMVWPTPLPEAPDWVLGSFRYGRKVVPMIDLHRRLAGRRPDPDPSWSIVVAFTPQPAGLVVSAIGDILDVPTRAVVTPSPEMRQAPFLSGALPLEDGRILYILSIERLVHEFDHGE